MKISLLSSVNQGRGSHCPSFFLSLTLQVLFPSYVYVSLQGNSHSIPLNVFLLFFWLLTYMWLKKLRTVPNNICATPRITDSFILYELRNRILFPDVCQIYGRERNHL